MVSPATARRRLLGLGMASGATVVVLAVLRPTASGGPDRDLVTGAADLAWLLALYLALAVAASCVATLRPSGSLPRRLSRFAPAAVHRFVEVAAGSGVAVALVTSAAGPAAAAGVGHHPAPPEASAVPSVDWPGVAEPSQSSAAPTSAPNPAPSRLVRTRPLPARAPVVAPPPRVRPVATPATATPPAAAEVVVRPGDSLWTIAARRLGRRATPAAVAASWPGWWTANRSVIGPDPDLIHPGQRLMPPDPDPRRQQ